MVKTAPLWLCAVMATFAAAASGHAAAPEPADPWLDLVRDVFDGRALAEDTGVVSIEMPARAEDAAIVPVRLRLRLPAGDPRHVSSVTLVIDHNPAPVAAKFEFGPDAGVDTIATRVRVDSYTNVHAVAELSDGSLHATKIFVKASGGCSAPAAKNADEAKANLGRMRLRQFARADAREPDADRPDADSPDATKPDAALRQAQIMIRHPNNSGLQMDQVTRLYTPAFFVRDLSVWQGNQLLLKVDAGISISEDPNFRFTYRPNGAGTLRAEAVDTDGHVFKGEWPAEVSE